MAKPAPAKPATSKPAPTSAARTDAKSAAVAELRDIQANARHDDPRQSAERLAAQTGCSIVAFQTGRPGLTRLAKKQGYRIKGFIMEKSVK